MEQVLVAIGPSLLGGELLYGVVRRVSLLVMAMASAVLCLGKLRDADPAEIF